jgi:hypothetical protein
LDAASVFFGRRLLELIHERQATWQKPLLMGQMADFAEYKDRAGYLRALADVVKMMESITMQDEESHGLNL